jgi:plastocyanin
MPLRLSRRAFTMVVAPLAICLSALMTLTVLLDLTPVQARSISPGASTTLTDVSVVDFAFEPAIITITAGSTVRWTRSNTSVFTHTTTSNTGVWNSGDLAPHDPFAFTFDTPGIYLYHCDYHALSMQGAVIVLGAQPPTTVTIDGPLSGAVDTAHTFTASVDPITVTQPITYVWQATGQSDVIHHAGLSDTVVFTWTTGITGTQLITATASNDYGSIAGTHLFIINANQIYLPLILR